LVVAIVGGQSEIVVAATIPIHPIGTPAIVPLVEITVRTHIAVARIPAITRGPSVIRIAIAPIIIPSIIPVIVFHLRIPSGGRQSAYTNSNQQQRGEFSKHCDTEKR